jgi:hypothetical protein
MARPQKPTPKQPLITRSITLTTEANETLHQLSQEASDALGWTVGSSAVLRALLQYVGQQPPSWVSATLHPLIEKEGSVLE